MIVLKVFETTGVFAENKDTAAKWRKEIISPAILSFQKVVIDFKHVDSSTQSFIHALISDSFQKHGEDAIDFFEFRNCTSPIKVLITAVINYSLE